MGEKKGTGVDENLRYFFIMALTIQKKREEEKEEGAFLTIFTYYYHKFVTISDLHCNMKGQMQMSL